MQRHTASALAQMHALAWHARHQMLVHCSLMPIAVNVGYGFIFNAGGGGVNRECQTSFLLHPYQIHPGLVLLESLICKGNRKYQQELTASSHIYPQGNRTKLKAYAC